MENTDNDLLGRECYVCGVDLMQQYKRDNTNKQNDLNASTQKFPEMIRYDGQRKEVCSWCYKSIEEGLQVYQTKNPSWVRPKARE